MKQGHISFRTVKSSIVSPSHTCLKLCKWNRCKDMFDNNIELIRHLQNVHFIHGPAGRSNACKWKGCKINGHPFTKATHLHRHVLQHHGGPRPYICGRNGCNKAFSKESNLITHVASHSGMSSPEPTLKPPAKVVETPVRQRQLLHFRCPIIPAAKQVDPIDEPVMLAIDKWIKEGRCRSIRLLKEREDVPVVSIGKRLTKFGMETLSAPVTNPTDFRWTPDMKCVNPAEILPTTMVTLLSAIKASANTEP